MKPYLVFIPLIILSLFQAVFLPLNLVLLVVVFWAAVRPSRETYLVAFGGGLILDLASGQPLGFSSLLFLIFTFLVQLYSRRFELAHSLVLIVFVFAVSLVYNLARQRPWLIEGAWLAACSLLAAPWLRRFWKSHGGGLKLGIP